MTNIVDNNVFDDVPLIEEGDVVKGGINGDANKQAIALANRTKFLSTELNKSNQKLANLTPFDINAEDRGTAQSLIGAHEADPDPHSQYLEKTDAATTYVAVSGANVPGGFAQLDANGKIPSALLDMIQSSYVAVADETERLALPATDNLTIAAQVDIDTLFYLNGGLDPAVKTNWTKGQSATVSGVSRVFGRTGDIVAQAGDYNADQITETPTRLFVSPTEKQSWAQKQEKLVSGTSIKTFKGNSLLGSGDFNPTPQQLGCAPTQHTHPTTDLTGFDSDVKTLIGGNVVPGTGISVGFDATTGKTVISTNLNKDGSSSYVAVKREKSIAGQLHNFNFTPIADFTYDAFALVSEAGATGQTYLVETFDAAAIANYNVSRDMLFTGMLEVYRGGSFPLVKDGTFYKSEFRTGVESMDLSVQADTIVPALSSNTGGSYKASASTEYSSNYLAYKAFDRLNAGGISDGWATAAGVLPTDAAPQWLRIDLPAAVKLTGYGLQNRLAGENGYINKWKLQGSNDSGTTWEDIGGVITDNDGTLGKIRTFPVNTTKAFKSYRLWITGSVTNYAFAFVQEWLLYSANPMMFLDDDGTTGYGIDNGALVTYPNVTAEQITQYGFAVAPKVTPALLAGKNIKTLASAQQLTAIIDAYPGPQIALPKKSISAKIWAAITAARSVSTLTGSGGFIKYAISRDNSEWFVFNGTAWVSIGTLTADSAGAAKLQAQGMDTEPFGNVTAAQWKSFFPDGTPDTIAVAYGLNVTNSASVAKLDSFSFIVDNASSWRKCTPTEVEIRWRGDSVSFKTAVAGDYILAYMFP